jgi:hypothetical protein
MFSRRASGGTLALQALISKLLQKRGQDETIQKIEERGSQEHPTKNEHGNCQHLHYIPQRFHQFVPRHRAPKLVHYATKLII